MSCLLASIDATLLLLLPSTAWFHLLSLCLQRRVRLSPFCVTANSATDGLKTFSPVIRSVQFNGTAKGKIADLDVKGHLQASNAEFALGSTDVLLDSVVTDAEYSPNTGVIVANSTIKRGTAVLNVEGKIAPRKVVSPRRPSR